MSRGKCDALILKRSLAEDASGLGKSASRVKSHEGGKLAAVQRFLRRFGAVLGMGNFPLKIVMTAAASMFLSGAISNDEDVKMSECDVLVYCSIYCGWVVCFLPSIMLHLNSFIIGKIFSLFFRMFAAELAVSVYLFLKGEPDVLQRGLSLRPLLGPGCQWMVEFVHTTRFVLIVGCLSSSLVAHLFDRPELLPDSIEATELEEEQEEEKPRR